MPTQCLRRSSKIEWSTVSNAALRSKRFSSISGNQQVIHHFKECSLCTVVCPKTRLKCLKESVSVLKKQSIVQQQLFHGSLEIGLKLSRELGSKESFFGRDSEGVTSPVQASATNQIREVSIMHTYTVLRRSEIRQNK